MKQWMRRFLCAFMCVMCCGIHLQAQEVVTVEVCDKQGNRLSYPEVVVGEDFHRVGSEAGTIALPLELLRAQGAFRVKYLGYKPRLVTLDKSLRANEVLQVALDEDIYTLDALVVEPKDFSAMKYFGKRKKNALLPFGSLYYFDLDFVLSKQHTSEEPYQGKIQGATERAQTSFDDATLALSRAGADTTKVLTALKRATEISYTVADAFCHRRGRGRFNCIYKGRVDSLELWEFVLRHDKKEDWSLQPSARFVCLVSLDAAGYIRRVQTQLTSSSEHSVSYFLDTHYGLYKQELIPERIELALIPTVNSKLQEPMHFSINYTNQRGRR